jgi:hypothetical protein
MPRSELSQRARGASDLSQPFRGGVGRRLQTQAATEALASDLNAMVAQIELANVEFFYERRLATDARVAREAESLAKDNPTATPLLADTCLEYQQAARSIGHRRFLP